MRKTVSRFGRALALGAFLALALHIQHSDADHAANPSHHHCCLCHSVSMGSAPSAPPRAPSPLLAFVRPAAPSVSRRVDPLFLNAPRPPPVA